MFVISVAAELAGVHPQTLRIYERKGLVDPSRTGGGSRRYSPADIERIRYIGALTAGGLNLEGVRRVLEFEAQLEKLRTRSSRCVPRLPMPSSASTACTAATWCRCGR